VPLFRLGDELIDVEHQRIGLAGGMLGSSHVTGTVVT
jgi:hypothetical protein